MRPLISFLVLCVVKAVSTVFYRHRCRWIGDVPERPWTQVRLVAGLNHTSLFEPLYIGSVPFRFLWEVAKRGVIPAADKTIRRPILGRFINTLARDVVSITREPDHTWQAVLQRIAPESLVVIFPEGRMKRADGFDSSGQPMSVRGGIADILHTVESGRMLIAYLGGLHHVQIPGQKLPRLFKRIEIAFEAVDIADYRRIHLEAAGEDGFKTSVREDLQKRRDLYCGAA